MIPSFVESMSIFNASDVEIRAYLLTLALRDVWPHARVVHTNRLDDYPAYYVLLPVVKKLMPVQLGLDYWDAVLAVDDIRQIYYTCV